MEDHSRIFRIVAGTTAILAAVAVSSAVTAAICLKSTAVSEAKSLIQQKFYSVESESPTSADLDAAAIAGMAAALDDPYAAYYTEEEYAAYLESVSGEYRGIGVEITQAESGYPVIVKVYAGSNAEKAGCQKGDEITVVNGTETGGLTTSEVVALFSDEGENVFTVLRDGNFITLRAEKGPAVIPYAEYEMLEDDLALLTISGFSGNVDSECRSILLALTEAGVSSLIIDLRDNPGGSLDKLISVTDYFVDSGLEITTIQGTDGTPVTYACQETPIYQGNIVLLVNGDTASAAELFTGCLSCHGLAKTVGTKTYGKGIVQTTYDLSGTAGYLKFTTAAYYLPDGTCIQGTGITPDCVVELPEEYQSYPVELLPRDADTQLAKAIDIIKEEKA